MLPPIWARYPVLRRDACGGSGRWWWTCRSSPVTADDLGPGALERRPDPPALQRTAKKRPTSLSTTGRAFSQACDSMALMRRGIEMRRCRARRSGQPDPRHSLSRVRSIDGLAFVLGGLGPRRLADHPSRRGSAPPAAQCPGRGQPRAAEPQHADLLQPSYAASPGSSGSASLVPRFDGGGAAGVGGWEPVAPGSNRGRKLRCRNAGSSHLQTWPARSAPGSAR